MGNTNVKNNYYNNRKYTSQYSLRDGLSGSIRSTQSSHRRFKPWSHASHRSWSEGTLHDPLGSSKTLWPVSRSQSIFLPEFPIKQVALLDNYIFLNMLAKGAFGKVYRVQKRDDGQIFALKIIKKAKIIAENGVQQAKLEVAIQKLVGHHPFLLNCCYKWQDKKRLYIMTDYIGRELFSLIEECGPLPENVVRIYVAEVALAIDFLHNAGIVHRDVKATNILLDDEGHAVLIDFGLAKWLTHSERTNTICGTPEYMAPEILNKEYYGQEVDWWSLGVLACFLLTCQYPSLAPSEVLPDGREVDPTREHGSLPDDAETLSAAARDLLRRLLQPHPRQRLQSLLALQRIAFYMGCDLQSYMLKKESPYSLLGCEPEAKPVELIREFSEFDSAAEDSFSYARN